MNHNHLASKPTFPKPCEAIKGRLHLFAVGTAPFPPSLISPCTSLSLLLKRTVQKDKGRTKDQTKMARGILSQEASTGKWAIASGGAASLKAGQAREKLPTLASAGHDNCHIMVVMFPPGHLLKGSIRHAFVTPQNALNTTPQYAQSLPPRLFLQALPKETCFYLFSTRF